MINKSNLPDNFISWDESVDRVGGDEEFLIELLNDLKDLVEDNLDKIKNLISENNYSEVRELAHSIKGSSGNLGLYSMYENTMNLENSAKEENSESMNIYFKNLEDDFDKLQQLLNN